MKPGWKTSEFWITLVTTVVALLVMLQVLSQAEADSLRAQLVQLVQVIGGLYLAVQPLIEYIRARTELKSDMFRADLLKKGGDGRE